MCIFMEKTSSHIRGVKYLWQMPQTNPSLVSDVARTYNLSFPVAQTLVARGIDTPEQIDSFIFSSLERDVADPALLKDASKAVERIIRAIDTQEKILIFGDYDVDGITSSAMMMLSLLALHAQVNFFLPHRVKDGYGLSTKIVERAAHNGYTLIITVDNGITAFEAVTQARNLGIDVIITDHHKPHGHMPDAYAIVNPHRNDCQYPFKSFAGVGVTFKILTLLYKLKNKELSPKVYELLLLGTIADVVPLTGENRFWVRYGLNFINNHETLSLKVLKANGKINKEKISATDIGFSLTPQINALGRLEDPRQGVKFLIGADINETEEVGRILFELNERRKEIEQKIIADIVTEIENGSIDLSRENIIIAASQEWPPGVIGLVASRIVGRYAKPTILLHLGENGIAKGSCRSIPEFNMFEALSEAHHLLQNFGGHSLAAGLALKQDNIASLKQYLEDRISRLLTPFDLQPKLTIDAEAQLSEVTNKLVLDLHHLEPFGNCNTTPTFYFRNVTLVQQPQFLKNAHVKCLIFSHGIIKPVIFFNRPELFMLLSDNAEKSFDIVAQISENHWNQKISIELTGIDIALSEVSI